MSIGEVLSQARRDSGLTVMHVAERTRIRETVIRSIEQDDYSMCGGNFYARGHIRSIARVLGVDPEPLIREYDDTHGGAPGVTASAAMAFEPETPLKFKERRQTNWSAAMAAVLALVAVWGIVQFFSGDQGEKAAPVVAKDTVTAAPAAEKTPGPDAVAAVPPVKKGHVLVQIRATAQSWVRVEPVEGDKLFMGTLAKGKTGSWTGKKVGITLGNAGGVVLTVNGKDLGVPGKDGQVVRLFFDGDKLGAS
ncbi:helix-turn-helix domain-containing protein [Actinocorallia aurea]